MRTGGIPTANRTHAMDACLAALEMQRAIRLLNERRGRLRLPTLDLRVGIHSGPVMAGIVGKRKFTYDIWGDAVNLAARLESASEPGRVNVSPAIVAQTGSFFSFAARGRVEIKNKDPMDMYFLERLRPEFAADAAGDTPNDALMQQRALLAAATMGDPGSVGAPG